MANVLAEQILEELKAKAQPEKVSGVMKYFKTGEGQYGEGDLFLGVKVPDQRKLAKRYQKQVIESDLEYLIQSAFHEARLTALFLLVYKFEKAKTIEIQKYWVDFYLNNVDKVNNWDLVDNSAPKILGAWLWDKDRSLLYQFANSGKLWEERIAILSTFHFIKKGDYKETLQLAEILMNKPHDLIHKATGWMIREVGNRDFDVALSFIKQFRIEMPRTMLRYAIEKFDPQIKKELMGKSK